MEIFRKIFGTKNRRELKRIQKYVTSTNALEPTMQALSDQQLRDNTQVFRQRLADGESLELLLPEAFATVREVSSRVLSMRHFDVQIIGGVALYEGRIAEMRTGEGKTLVATLAAYLNALTGQGVHIVTVNDYLSKRDAHWMGPIYHALGISLGIIQSMGGGEETSFLYSGESVNLIEKFEHLQPCTRMEAYAADVVYGTNNEFGFDYLRTNMVLSKEDRLQRELSFAIVDEVDSILIDEARTPLVMSGSASNRTEEYININQLVKALQRQPEGHTKLLTALDKDEIRSFDDVPWFTNLQLKENAQATVNQLSHLEKDSTLANNSKNEQIELLLQQLRQQLAADFTVDEKMRTIELTDLGFEKMEAALVQSKLLATNDSLYNSHNLILLQNVNNALRAWHLFHRNVEYIVQQGEVILIDEHTGRKMPGRRLSEGLHQAIEAKEKLSIQNESQTMASTTFQNYFRLYDKLSGMTGTADTEAAEFQSIYNLPVLVIPTNKPVNRQDLNDLIYINKEDKYNAVINDIRHYQSQGAPVLVGSISIEVSEILAQLLKQADIKHEVLNAKQHEREAEIIATAGEPGRVTIATNMAGRGTDIVLGGNLDVELVQATDENGELEPVREQEIREQWHQRHQQVIEAGGLHVIGTERHESRRIDNQLRGRSGRQGDPGLSRFYLSMEDDLMRLFASDRVRNMMHSLGMNNGEAIEHRMVSNSIEKAQRKVETRNFDIRKSLLEYDDVSNDQRMVIYRQRNEIIDDENLAEIIEHIRQDVVVQLVDIHLPADSFFEQWDISGLEETLRDKYNLIFDIETWFNEDETRNSNHLKDELEQRLQDEYQQKIAQFPEDIPVDQFLRDTMLRILDNHWREHLALMDSLRHSIGLRSYAQKNPRQEYKREAFELFQVLLDDVKKEFISHLAHVRLLTAAEISEIQHQQRQQELALQRSLQNNLNASEESELRPNQVKTVMRVGKKVGRNSPCVCGSGKKYKQCCGKQG